jgi:hypothetical protein
MRIHLAAEGFDVEVFHCCFYCKGIRAEWSPLGDSLY